MSNIEIASIEIKECSSLCDVIVYERDSTHALIEIKCSFAIKVVELDKLIIKVK
jgi:hypothetical protein